MTPLPENSYHCLFDPLLIVNIYNTKQCQNLPTNTLLPINFEDHTTRSWISTNVNNEQCEIEKTNSKFIYKQAFDS